MLVSVIVPVFNMEKYLSRCLDSIYKQTYSNIEVLLVNDGSTDGSEEILKKWSVKDVRFRYFYQDNQGLSAARNTALLNSKGDYIIFVDPDDWLDLDLIEKLVEYSSSFSFDIVIFPYIAEYGSKRKVFDLLSSDHIYEDIYPIVYPRLFGLKNEQLASPLDSERFNTAWSKFYKRESIYGLKFTDTKQIGTEDAWFNIQAMYNKKIGFLPDSYYHYYKVNNSSITSNYNEKLQTGWLNLYKLIEEFITLNNLDVSYLEALENRIVLNLLSLILNIMQSNLSIEGKKKEIDKLLNKEIYKSKFKLFQLSKLPIFWRIFYFLCKTRRTELVFFYTFVLLFLKERLT